MAQIRLDLRSWFKRSVVWTQHKLLVLSGVTFQILKAVSCRTSDIAAQAGAETSLLVIRLTVCRRLHISER